MPALEPLESLELPPILIDVSVFRENVDKLQVVALPGCVVVVVVGRCDFDASRPELPIYHLISDYFEFSVR